MTTILLQTTYAIASEDLPYDFDLWTVGMIIAGIIAFVMMVREMRKRIV